MDKLDKKESPNNPQEKIIRRGEQPLLHNSYSELKYRVSDLERFRALIQQMDDAIFLIRMPAGVIVDCNDAAARVLNCNRINMLNVNFTEVFSHEGMGKIHSLVYGGKLQVGQWEMIATELIKTGTSSCPVQVNCRGAIFDSRLYVIAIVRPNLTGSRREETAQNSDFKSQALIQAIPDLLFMLTKHGVIWDYREGNGYQLIVPPEKFLKKRVDQVWPQNFAHQVLRYLKKAWETGHVQRFESEFSIKGETYYQEIRIVVAGQYNLALMVVRDIADQQSLERKIKQLNVRDYLTGLYNRTYFEEELLRIEQNGESNVGLIICDIDGLKLVNDAHGHRAGDEIMKSVGNILKQLFPGNVVARVGGDEFCLILRETTTQDLEQYCREIRHAIKNINDEDTSLSFSCSVGFAFSGPGPTNMLEMFKMADHNMHREKLHQSQSTRSAIVQALLTALEARDHITEGHADRLQVLIEELGLRVGLTDHYVNDLRLFAQFHDIGKVGVPDRILFKPGKLTYEETLEMRRHCEIGMRIAQAAPDLMPISDWILKHHEWWNGQGYPLGLKEENIPLACRMLAIIDAYDAMTNDRPYRKALSREEAIDQIKSNSGIQFDPTQVELFCEVVENLN